MWQKLKQQIPAILATVVLVSGAVVGATVYTMHQIVGRQDAALVPLRQENEALQAQATETQQQLAATNQLLKEMMAHRTSGDLLAGSAEDQKSRQEQIAILADDLAKKIQPALPAPKSPEEVARAQQEQVDRVADRVTDNLRPVFTQQTAEAERRADVAEVKAQKLSEQLAATQAAAQDALKLTHEVSSMYYDSFRDHGVLVRLMSLPAELVIDTAKGNLVTGRDRAAAEKTISTKMSDLEKRLNDISISAGTTRS